MAGDSTPHDDDGRLLYPDAYSIGSLLRKLDVTVLYKRGKRERARFVFEIAGPPKPGEVQQPTEYRDGLYLSATEAITIAEARALGQWLCKKADEYDRPKSRLSIRRLLGTKEA
jgi:hypothetical protein